MGSLGDISLPDDVFPGIPIVEDPDIMIILLKMF